MMTTRRAVLQGAAALGAVALVARPALGAGTGNIFVSLEKGNEVVVLDKSYVEIKRIKTSKRPRDMHFNQDRTQLFVACGDDDAIDVIDVSTLEVVDTIPTGPSPEVFAFTPDYKGVWVSDEEYSQLELIDLETRVSTVQVPTGAEPEGVIVSEDGKLVYVTSEVADMVHVVDVASGAVIKNILVGTRPRRFIFTPDGKQLWVSCELSSEIFIIDRETHEIVGDSLFFVPPGFKPEDVTPVGMAVTRDGSKILLTLGRANHIAVIDGHTHEIIKYILVGKRAWSVDLSPDESVAIVSNGLSDDITIIDMASLEATQTIPVGRVPHTVMIDG